MPNYNDIIHLPHHVSKKRPQMPLSQRAAIFAPFSALTGYEDQIKETDRITTRKVELTEEEAKTAAENVTRLLEALKRYQSLEARRKEKLSNLRKEYESLPDDSYKKKQVWSKIKVLERIAEPKWVNTKKDE